MAVKAGQFLHDAYGFIVDRIQTGGATTLNIPEEKVYEVGNFEAVATIRDTPDLSFGLESRHQVLPAHAWVGIGLVSLSMIANFLFIPYYPVWSLVVIALEIAIIAAPATPASRR